MSMGDVGPVDMSRASLEKAYVDLINENVRLREALRTIADGKVPGTAWGDYLEFARETLAQVVGLPDADSTQERSDDA